MVYLIPLISVQFKHSLTFNTQHTIRALLRYLCPPSSAFFMVTPNVVFAPCAIQHFARAHFFRQSRATDANKLFFLSSHISLRTHIVFLSCFPLYVFAFNYQFYALASSNNKVHIHAIMQQNCFHNVQKDCHTLPSPILH